MDFITYRCKLIINVNLQVYVPFWSINFLSIVSLHVNKSPRGHDAHLRSRKLSVVPIENTSVIRIVLALGA